MILHSEGRWERRQIEVFNLVCESCDIWLKSRKCHFQVAFQHPSALCGIDPIYAIRIVSILPTGIHEEDIHSGGACWHTPSEIEIK